MTRRRLAIDLIIGTFIVFVLIELVTSDSPMGHMIAAFMVTWLWEAHLTKGVI